MRGVRPVVKWVGIAILVLALLAYVGFNFGFTPLPKPPPGVRLAPGAAPLSVREIRQDNGAFYYLEAAALMTNQELSAESKAQMEALLADNLTSETGAIEATLEECRPALALIREGARLESCRMPLQAIDEDTHWIQALSRSARMLVCEGKLAERAGRTEDALDDYGIVTTFGADCTRGGPLLYSSAGHAMTRMGTRAIRASASRPNMPPESLARTQWLLETLRDRRQSYDETLRYELLGSKQAVQRMLQQQRAFRVVAMQRSYSAMADAAFGDLIQDAQKPFAQRETKQIVAKWELDHRPMWVRMFDRPVPRILLSLLMTVFDKTSAQMAATDVDLESTIVICALNRFQRTHGRLPEHLSELVPECLAAMPIDPFDGKPLRYRLEEGEWIVWSVGADLKDDNAAWYQCQSCCGKPGQRAGGDIYFRPTGEHR